ncbi:Centrosomal protein of 104 kDa [Hondaea fermentalgiana]|uniref:Centrosomal protein of 104 kDa n=1 Tax=Hondaea fermentalgiana TaxID=2315210 RepID=A0A2R5GHB4_9STRA|nr:Centrosomal protein of 104 kDa [Hondaea fermentalgiana]|eukprot:GBG27244.1 Centrosomal protein of 104 kDa [Hondaea fermentalgiana]
MGSRAYQYQNQDPDQQYVQQQQQQQQQAKSRASAPGKNAAPGKGPKQVKFEVVYCSGEDPEFPASELNVHSPQTQGWQSPPFCAYPQEIGLGFLVGEVDLAQLQILSHQSKIATKIDVYVGRGNSYESCNFRRLGHLSLDSNERSNFAARELKSVYIGKQGSFLKLLIHKCHLNSLNIYNQVGVMAINVLGHAIANGNGHPGRDGYLAAESNQRMSEGRGGSDRAYPTAASRQVPPLQDLAVDMQFDPVTAKLLREVHDAKERAVEEEEYELAKQLKEAEGRLKHVGVKLARLEAAKRDAVACEDYDQAAVVKRDMQAIRADLEAEVSPLLYRRPSARQPAGPPQQRHSGSHQSAGPHSFAQPQQPHDSHFNAGYGPSGGPAPPYGEPHASHYNNNEAMPEDAHMHNNGLGGGPAADGPQTHHGGHQHTFSPQMPAQPGPVEDERPLPVLQHQEQQRQHSPSGAANGMNSARSAGRLPGDEPTMGGMGGANGMYEDDEAAGPATDPAVIAEALDGVAGADELPEAEPLPKGLGNEVQPLIDAFGEYLVRCLYSRQVRLRAAAMSKLEIDLERKFDMSDARIFGAICTVCRMSATDKIANIYMQGVKLLETASTRANDAGGLRRHDVHPLVEPLMPLIIDKLGNNAARIRDATTQLLQHLARLKVVGVHTVAGAVLKLLRPGKSMLWRQLLGRLKLLADLIAEFEMKDANGLSLEAVMSLITAYSGHVHPNAEVRECAKEVVLQVYAQVGDAVMPYLKDLRPKQMEEYEAGFDQIDRSQGRSPVKRAARADTENKPTARSARSTRSHGSPTPGKAKKGAHSSKSGAAGGGNSPGARTDRSRRAGSNELDEGSPRSQEVNININVSHGRRHENEEELLPERNGSHKNGGRHAVEDDDDDVSYEEEPFTCQFCGRHDPEFTDDALDIHYWKECPMLTSCLQCEQVIEVAMLNDHLLNECEMKHNHERCPRCGEAIAAQYFNQHVKRASCRPSQSVSKANRCPLCHEDVKPGEDGWREHILIEPGCNKNPRTEHLRG